MTARVEMRRGICAAKSAVIKVGDLRAGLDQAGLAGSNTSAAAIKQDGAASQYSLSLTRLLRRARWGKTTAV